MRIEVPTNISEQDPTNQTHSQKNVNSMKTSHRKVETKVHSQILRTFGSDKKLSWQQTIMKFVRVLDVLDSHKDESAENCDDQTDVGFLVVASLNLVNSKCHRERTDDENDRICSTQLPVQKARTRLKHFRIESVHQEKANKKSTEHQNLGHHEKPNAFLR